MNNGMKLILARMETNPEEFVEKYKWRRLVESDWPMFTEEEQKAYSAKLREILIDRFSEEVLKTLMEDENEDKPTMKYKASDRYATGWIDARAFKTISLTPTQVAMANGLGIPLADYAKELLKKGI
jgi:ribosomal protein S12 methylthiotransferase accessory factor YcaO